MDYDRIGLRLSDELEVVTPDMLKAEEENLPLLPVPTPDEIEKAVKEWNETEPFSSYDRAMEKLFSVLPKNSAIEDVLPKVAVVNEFCSLNIRAVMRVAEHIVKSDIDSMLEKGDTDACELISSVRMRDGREYNFYSFATKYLAHHEPDLFPEYDTYTVKVLAWYRDKDDFSRFLKKELTEYARFRQIMSDFRRKYGLEEYSLKDIHTFLWLSGRKWFGERKEGTNGQRRY